VTDLFRVQLVHQAFGDPGLYVDFRDEKRALLFDLGDLSPLAPRQLLRVSHAFVTHTHMDHFAGFDGWLRVILGRKERITVTGGPRFIEQLEHKLRAYTWNVVHRYEVPLAIVAREMGADGVVREASFSSLERFERRDGATHAMQGDVLHDEATFRVRSRIVDHEMPCLAFALEEKARVNVARDRVEALGVTPGPWLRTLKQAVLAGAADDTAIELRWRDRDGDHRRASSVGELRHVILDVVPGRRIGYATDLRYCAPNVSALAQLFAGVDELYIESVFLHSDVDHATRKNHLTAQQAGTIARLAQARSLVPFHFSPRYEGREAELVAEARAAWRDPHPGPLPREREA
jgi:ribonuclease Z